MARRMTWDEKRYAAEQAAWRQIGRDHKYLWAFGPYAAPACGVVLLTAGLSVAWVMTPHVILGGIALGLGATPVAVFALRGLVRSVSGSGLRDRMLNRATGVNGPGLRPAFLLAGFSLIMFATSWLALGSPWS